MKIENYKKINQSIILYDSKCLLCNRYIHFIIRNDINENFYFTSIYSNTGKKIINDYKINTNLDDTIILYQENSIYKRSDAVLRTIKKLKFPINIIWTFYLIPRFIRDSIYKLISKNRYKMFGKNDQCIIPNKKHLNRFID